MIPKSSQLGAGGGKGEGPFRIFFMLGPPLAANMVRRPVPRTSKAAQTWLFYDLVSIFQTFFHTLYPFFIILGATLDPLEWALDVSKGGGWSRDWFCWYA